VYQRYTEPVKAYYAGFEAHTGMAGMSFYLDR
jgi:hypothetical protein